MSQAWLLLDETAIKLRRVAFALCMAGLLILLDAGPAQARSCIHAVSESMDLELTAVTRSGAAGSWPEEALPIPDELVNSAEEGRLVLLQQRASSRGARFFRQANPIAPDEVTSAYIAVWSVRELRTSCATSAPYVPIAPGRYVFDQMHADGSRTSAAIDDPVLSIPSDRSEATLDFSLRGEPWQALFHVRCASFPKGEGREPCAPALPTVAAPGTPVRPSGPGCGCAAAADARQGGILALLLLALASLSRRGRA